MNEISSSISCVLDRWHFDAKRHEVQQYFMHCGIFFYMVPAIFNILRSYCFSGRGEYGAKSRQGMMLVDEALKRSFGSL
jgi:hypothetical protein